MAEFQLAAAGDTAVPAFLVLREKGYTLRSERSETGELWFAERPGLRLIGGGPLELLGLVALYEIRGTNWRAPDNEIDAFMDKNYPRLGDNQR